MFSFNNLLQSIPLLLADAGRISNLGNRFRTGSGSSSIGLVFMIFAGMTAAIFGIYFLSKLLEKHAEKAQHYPWRLFKQLCKAHSLGFRHRWLLRQLVVSANLQHPASIFVKPETFDRVGRDAELAENKQHFNDIFDRIFAVDEDEED
jgi:hypothetical protein